MTTRQIKTLKEAKGLSQNFINHLIKNNGNGNEDTVLGFYKGFLLIDSDTDGGSIALNSKYYEENGFNISSFDGIEELKSYIDEEIEYGFKA
jgi:hypothetical protein